MRVQTHRDHCITWIDFDEGICSFTMAPPPKTPYYWGNTRPTWVCRPTCGCVEISIGDNICLDARYRSSELLVKRLVEWSEAEEVLKKMEDRIKISQAGLQWGTVEHNIGKRAFSLPKSCVPVTKSRVNSLELEDQEMKLTICALNTELVEANNMIAENQFLVSSGHQLYKLKSINKRP